MKKLLILIDTMKPMIDGVSIFLNNTLPYLAKKYEVTIIASGYSDETYKDAELITFPVIIKFGTTGYGPSKINRKIIKREVKKCDFIFNHESVSPFSASFFASKYARKYKKPFFTYVHSIDWELFPETVKIPLFIRKIAKSSFKIFVGWYLKSHNNIVLVSFPTIKDILKKNRVSGRFEIAPIGIPNFFRPGKSKFCYGDKIVIGYAGRLSREKGLRILLNDFLKLSSKFDNIFLLIVGDGPDRWIFDNKENIEVTGFISQGEVAEYLRAMDIFVLPSFTEANSISTLEAIRSGVCCVTRDVGAIRDYLKNGYNGFLFDKDSELLDILEKLIKDEKLRKKIQRNAGKSVSEYTWENTADKLIKVFEKY